VRRPRSGAVAVLLLVALLPACSGDPGSPAPTAAAADALRMASYDFAENQVLVEVYAEAARRAGVPVAVAHGIGTREIVWPAVEQGLADAVVDYTGTALAFARPDAPAEQSTPEQARAELERTLGGRGITALGAADAEDQNGFAVTRAFADEHHVGALSDLAPLAGSLRAVRVPRSAVLSPRSRGGVRPALRPGAVDALESGHRGRPARGPDRRRPPRDDRPAADRVRPRAAHRRP
jgi:osmoprotectant transport system substrate-binding protein